MINITNMQLIKKLIGGLYFLTTTICVHEGFQ